MIRINKRTGFVLAVAGATAIGSVSTAAVMAAIPDSSGAIHGCYSNGAGLFTGKGTVRIIDSASETCKSGETAINWNQTGQKGDKGDKGDTGSAGATGATGAAGPKGDKGDPGEGNEMIGVRTTGLDNADFSTMNLSYYDFSHRTLKGVTFGNIEGADFSYTTFEDTSTHKAIFGGGSNINLSHADLHAISLGAGSAADSSDITGANLSGHNGVDPDDGIGSFGMELSNSNVTGTDLSDNNFVHAYFRGTDLTVADLTDTTWSDTRCPDNTNSDTNGGTCAGHLHP